MKVQPIEYYLSERRRDAHEQWLRGYRALRQQEERGSDDPSYYLALPAGDFSGTRAKEWRMRAQSLAWLKEYLRETYPEGSLRIVDAGAGNCWLTRHLAEWGHDVTAVDVNDDEYDGLGAGRHYLEHVQISFRRMLADFEDLPFDDGAYEVIIFNGSIHYTDDLRAVLSEARRVLRRDGRIIIVDSPMYGDTAAGERMVEERRLRGQAGFLTYDEIRTTSNDLGLVPTIVPRPAGPVARIKRTILRVRLGREPASMPWVSIRFTSD